MHLLLEFIIYNIYAVHKIYKLSVHFNIFCIFKTSNKHGLNNKLVKDINKHHTTFIRLWGNIAAPTKHCKIACASITMETKASTWIKLHIQETNNKQNKNINN